MADSVMGTESAGRIAVDMPGEASNEEKVPGGVKMVVSGVRRGEACWSTAYAKCARQLHFPKISSLSFSGTVTGHTIRNREN